MNRILNDPNLNAYLKQFEDAAKKAGKTLVTDLNHVANFVDCALNYLNNALMALLKKAGLICWIISMILTILTM